MRTLLLVLGLSLGLGVGPVAAFAADNAGCSARAYACDNVAALGGGSACFAPTDAMHMTVGLWRELGSPSKFRVLDPGDGVPVRILARAENGALGVFYQVRTHRGDGWLSPHFLRRDPDQGAPCFAFGEAALASEGR